MSRIVTASVAAALLLSACAGSGGQFTSYQVEEFGETMVTATTTKSFSLGNGSMEGEQHIRAIAFDRGSNAAGHFRLDRITIGGREVPPTDIVVPPGSAATVQVSYSPQDLKSSQAAYGGWVTGEPRRWIPRDPNDAGDDAPEPAIHRAIIEAVYDHPSDGILYVELAGRATTGPNGETVAGGNLAQCTPGGGTACYEGGFALDIPKLAPGGPKPLDISGPIRMGISGGAATMRMEDFPFVIYYLRSEDIPQLPSGTTATLVISGAAGKEAAGTFDGARLTLKGVAFRIRVALGELGLEQIKQGMPALVDFVLPDLEITTISPLDQGVITLRLETVLPQNPSGNEMFDQFLSGAAVIATMEGNLAF